MKRENEVRKGQIQTGQSCQKLSPHALLYITAPVIRLFSFKIRVIFVTY